MKRIITALAAVLLLGTLGTAVPSHASAGAAKGPTCTSNWFHKYGRHTHNGAIRPYAYVYWTENQCGDETRIKLEWWQSGHVLGRRSGPWRTSLRVKSEVDGAANTFVADAWAQWRACTTCKIHTTQIADFDDSAARRGR